jgi:hypothetical protein
VIELKGEKNEKLTGKLDGIKWLPYNLSRTIETNPSLPSGGSNNNPGLAG